MHSAAAHQQIAEATSTLATHLNRRQGSVNQQSPSYSARIALYSPDGPHLSGCHLVANRYDLESGYPDNILILLVSRLGSNHDPPIKSYNSPFFQNPATRRVTLRLIAYLEWFQAYTLRSSCCM